MVLAQPQQVRVLCGIPARARGRRRAQRALRPHLAADLVLAGQAQHLLHHARGRKSHCRRGARGGGTGPGLGSPGPHPWRGRASRCWRGRGRRGWRHARLGVAGRCVCCGQGRRRRAQRAACGCARGPYRGGCRVWNSWQGRRDAQRRRWVRDGRAWVGVLGRSCAGWKRPREGRRGGHGGSRRREKLGQGCSWGV